MGGIFVIRDKRLNMQLDRQAQDDVGTPIVTLTPPAPPTPPPGACIRPLKLFVKARRFSKSSETGGSYSGASNGTQSEGSCEENDKDEKAGWVRKKWRVVSLVLDICFFILSVIDPVYSSIVVL